MAQFDVVKKNLENRGFVFLREKALMKLNLLPMELKSICPPSMAWQKLGKLSLLAETAIVWRQSYMVTKRCILWRDKTSWPRTTMQPYGEPETLPPH